MSSPAPHTLFPHFNEGGIDTDADAAGEGCNAIDVASAPPPIVEEEKRVSPINEIKTTEMTNAYDSTRE